MRQFSQQNQPAKTSSVPFASLRSTTPERTRAPDHGPSRTPALPIGFDFSRTPVYGKTPVGIQTKLTIGAAGDAFEQEADRVAEQVMRAAPERVTFPAFAGFGVLQRKCACAGEPGVSGQCAGCQEEGKLQRRAASTGEPTTAPPIVHEVLRSPGQPLDGATRAFMEPRFGHDFGRVRVHMDARAAASARAVNARAYTVGQDVVFAARQYVPETFEGRRLISHELAHVLQQSDNRNSSGLSASAPVIQRFNWWWPLNGYVVNDSSKPVTVWSNKNQFYEIPANSTSRRFSTEDVDSIKDKNGQWYKISNNNVTVDKYGTIRGYKCKVAKHDDDCPELEKPKDIHQGLDPTSNPAQGVMDRVRLGVSQTQPH
jgi:hypothetical protein